MRPMCLIHTVPAIPLLGLPCLLFVGVYYAVAMFLETHE